MCELFSMSARLPAEVRFSLEEFSRHGGLSGPHKDGSASSLIMDSSMSRNWPSGHSVASARWGKPIPNWPSARCSHDSNLHGSATQNHRRCTQSSRLGIEAKGLSVSSEHRDQSVVLIASAPLTTEDWEPLGTGETLTVAAGKILSRTKTLANG